jgi:hypothetical protein
MTKLFVRQVIPADLDLGTVRPGTYELVKCMGRGEARNSQPEPAYFLDNLTVSKRQVDAFIANGNAELIEDEEKQEEDKMSNLSVIKPVEAAVMVQTPREQIEAASDMARLLKDVVNKAGLAKRLGGTKEHLEFEAWQTIARWHHCTPSTEWTRPIMQGDQIAGWEARVNVLDETGRVIGSSEGMCMYDEKNWKGKPSYALRSMAQTRTAGKALRSLFAHIAVLAGYSPTPAEEMDGVEVRHDSPPPAPKAESKAPAESKDTPADAATEKQRKMLWAKGMTRWSDKQKATDFMTWLKAMAGVDYFTKKYASECIEDFDARAADFEEDATNKGDDVMPH